MNLMNPYLKKELMEWLRTQKLLILGAAILFFTFSTPLLLYILPILLKDQAPELLDLFQTSQRISLTNFTGDVYQIFGAIVLFIGYKTFTKEFKNGQFTLPWITGANVKKVYLSKFLSTSIIVFVLIAICTTFSHFYAGIIFNDFQTPFLNTINEIVGLSTFIIFHLSILFLMSSKNISAFITLPTIFGSYYILPGLINMLDPSFKTPYDLLHFDFSTLRFTTSLITLGIITLIVIISTITLKKPTIGAIHGRKTINPPSSTRT